MPLLSKRISPDAWSQYGLVFYPNLGGKIVVPVAEWVENGPPGPRRLVSPESGVHLESGVEVPVARLLPLRFRNDRWSRRLIRWGLLEPPAWHTPHPHF